MVDLIEEKNSVGGLGLASLDTGALELNQSASSLLERPKVQPKARIPDLTPPGPKSFKENIRDNPFGTLGTIFSSIAAGMQGRPLPIQQARDSRQRGLDARAGMFDTVLGIIKEQNAAIEGASPEDAAEIVDGTKQVVGHLIGDQQGANTIVDMFIVGQPDATKVFDLAGMGDTIVRMGLDELPPDELMAIALDPQRFNAIKIFHDNQHLGGAADKLKFMMDIFRQIRGSERLANIPGATGTAQDDMAAIFDAGNNIIIPQEQFLDRLQNDPNFSIDGEPLITPAEMASLRNNPDTVEAITGSKPSTKIVDERGADLRTPEGKLFQDIQDVTAQFGEDSPQAKAFEELLEPAPALTDIGAFRNQFTNLSKDFVKIRDAFVKVDAAAPTAAGDLALIFGFMKILDPTSVVREGEQATAANARGVPAAIRQTFNRLLAGEKLDETQRADFKARARELFETQLAVQIQLEDNFTNIAKISKFNPAEVIVDFIGDLREKKEKKPDRVLE